MRAIGLFDGNDGHLFAQHCKRNLLDKQANRLGAGAEHVLRKQEAEKSQNSGKASIHFGTLGNIRQTSQTNQGKKQPLQAAQVRGGQRDPYRAGFLTEDGEGFAVGDATADVLSVCSISGSGSAPSSIARK